MDETDPKCGDRISRVRNRLDRVVDSERKRELGERPTFVELIGVLESVKFDLLNEMEGNEDDD